MTEIKDWKKPQIHEPKLHSARTAMPINYIIKK